MSVFYNVVSMLGGVALFLYGMRIMGDGLKAGSSDALRKAMEKITNKPFTGFLVGLCVTCIIQSSTATIVLTAGLVGAGIITVHQSIGIILGANVGTTITGQIIRLLDINAGASSWLNLFKPSTLAPIAAIVGILMIMAFKSKNSNTIGTIAMGFGILFTGLLNMTAAVAPLSSSEAFSQVFVSLAEKPFLGFLAGTGVALTIQSSSATVGILQALSTTGQLTFSSIYSVLIGIYLGDCLTTAIMCWIGGKANQRRTGLIHILFNLSSGVLVFAAIILLRSFGVLDGIWNAPITSGGIANTNTIFKLICALVLLPVCGLFEKMSEKIVKDDPKSSYADMRDRFSEEMEALDKTFDSPAIALSSVHKAISTMASLSSASVFSSLEVLKSYSRTTIDQINEDEEFLDNMADNLSSLLVRLSPHAIMDEESEKVNYYIRCVNEFERIGDCAVNISESADDLKQRDREFTDVAKAELDILRDILNEIISYTKTTFIDQDLEAAHHIEPLEEVVDDLVASLREHHVQRLRQGKCSVTTSFIFMDILTNVERISDQCSNIGVQTISQSDPEVASMGHDYLRELHQGEDTPYSSMFKEAREKYFSRLATVQAAE